MSRFGDCVHESSHEQLWRGGGWCVCVLGVAMNRVYIYIQMQERVTTEQGEIC